MVDKNETLNEKSLLSCTVKKSISVFEKFLVAASKIIVGITIGVILAYGVFAVVAVLLQPSVLIISVLINTIVSIPWYYYAALAILGAIPGYSFLWCIAKDLTKDDWSSDSANTFAALITIGPSLTLAALALVPAFTTLTFSLPLAFTLAFAALAFTFSFAFAVDPVDKVTVLYYIFRFCGAAWNHYARSGAP